LKKKKFIDIDVAVAVSNRRVNHYSGANPSDSPWKPKKYAGPNMFVPRNEYEETILLLLISEAMAVRDAVLSQSPEFKEARIHAFENATAIYDLLTVVVVRWSQVELLHEVEIFSLFLENFCHRIIYRYFIVIKTHTLFGYLM